MTKNLLPGLTALVFAVSCMSAEAKLSDDPSGLRVLADNELGRSGRAPVEYVWGNEIPSDSTAAVSTLAANQPEDQLDSYYAGDGLMSIVATGLAVILLGGLALVGSALRRREAWQAGRPQGWRAELMDPRKRPRQFRRRDAGSPEPARAFAADQFSARPVGNGLFPGAPISGQ